MEPGEMKELEQFEFSDSEAEEEAIEGDEDENNTWETCSSSCSTDSSGPSIYDDLDTIDDYRSTYAEYRHYRLGHDVPLQPSSVRWSDSGEQPSSLMTKVQTIPEIVDLLIRLTRYASYALDDDHENLVFDPFPSIKDPRTDKWVLKKNDSEENNYIEAAYVMAMLPDVKDLIWKSSEDIKTTLNKSGPLQYNMLLWIISTNPSHIVRLPVHEQLTGMATPYQYIHYHSADKEKTFKSAKDVYGSCFLFHGSPTANWYSILRRGLIISTGTAYEAHGFGEENPGIFLTHNAREAYKYSDFFQAQFPQEKLSPSTLLPEEKLACIALCEVVTSPHLSTTKSIIDSDSCTWICTNSDHVAVRYLFVYKSEDYKFSTYSDITVNLMDIQCGELIDMTVQKYRPA